MANSGIRHVLLNAFDAVASPVGVRAVPAPSMRPHQTIWSPRNRELATQSINSVIPAEQVRISHHCTSLMYGIVAGFGAMYGLAFMSSMYSLMSW